MTIHPKHAVAIAVVALLMAMAGIVTVVSSTGDALEDDNIFLGSANDIGIQAEIPDCDTTTSHKLQYDQATNALTCDSTAPGSSITTQEDNADDQTVSQIDWSTGIDRAHAAGEDVITVDPSEFGANWIDAVTDMTAGIRSGSDATVVTGTSGSSGNCAEWDANGDIIDAGGGCGGGSAITFDIDDDGGNDSTDVNEIATTGDTNSIFTESSPDKILIALANNWPSADTADALDSNPADCGANNFATTIAANGDLTCAQPGFTDLSGSATDAQVPNTITIDLAAAATALAANPADCAADNKADSIAASGALTCSPVDTGDITDGTILEADLNAIDAPIDEECLTSEGTGFEWQTCSAGSGDVTAVGNCATGACFTGASGTTLTSNTDIILDIDDDSNGTESFQVRDGADNIIFEVTEANNVSFGDGTTGSVFVTFDGDAGADGLFTWNTTSDIVDVDLGINFDNTGADSSAAVWTPDTGTVFSAYVENTGDDLQIEVNTASTENIDIVNAGAGVVDLSVDSLATGGASECLQADTSGVLSITGSACGGGSGSMTTVEESDVQLGGSDIVTLNFGVGFDLTESPDTQINILLDYTEDPVDLGTGDITGTLDVSANTNLAVSGSLLDLTGDTLSVNEGTLTDNNLCDYEVTGTQIECVTNTKAELEGIITDVADFAEADGDIFTGVHDFGGATSIEIVNGTGNTVNADGEIAHDTTADQLIIGADADVISTVHQVSFTLEDPADADNFLLGKWAAFGITVTDIFCIVDPADSAESVVIDLQERDATGDSPATLDATITCDNDGAEDDGALSNGTIDKNDWWSLDIGTVTGTVTQVTVTAVYTITRE